MRMQNENLYGSNKIFLINLFSQDDTYKNNYNLKFSNHVKNICRD